MRWTRILPAALLVMTFAAPSGPRAQDQDVFDAIDQDWADFSESLETDFRAYLDETDAAYQQLVDDVEARWGEFVESTKTVWSSYSSDLGGRAEVDFENGTIELELVVDPAPEGPVPGIPEIGTRLAAELERVLSASNPAGRPVLEGQVDAGGGQPLQPEMTREYVERILRESPPVSRPQTGGDGVTRQVYKVDMTLVPDHLAKRAAPYMELVRQNASRYDLDTSLILAVIHTESYFNPLARSHVPAYGLMQLVPSSGGTDAYEAVYGVQQAPTPEFLYEPTNNIQLGSAYFQLLFGRYFDEVSDPRYRTWCCIAAYNCGPGGVRRAVRKSGVEVTGLSGLDQSSVYDILHDGIPEETKGYLEKVTTRMSLYGDRPVGGR